MLYWYFLIAHYKQAYVTPYTCDMTYHVSSSLLKKKHGNCHQAKTQVKSTLLAWKKCKRPKSELILSELIIQMTFLPEAFRLTVQRFKFHVDTALFCGYRSLSCVPKLCALRRRSNIRYLAFFGGLVCSLGVQSS